MFKQFSYKLERLTIIGHWKVCHSRLKGEGAQWNKASNFGAIFNPKNILICYIVGRQIYNLLSQPQFCRVRESNLVFSCYLLQFYKGATAGVISVSKNCGWFIVVNRAQSYCLMDLKKYRRIAKRRFLEANDIINKKIPINMAQQ